MPFAPRASDEIRQSIIAYLVSTGVLTAINEGDVAATIAAAYADDMAAFESRVNDWINFYFLSVSGPDLDDRIAQIPGLRPRDRGTPAFGEVRLVRNNIVDQVTFSAGTFAIANPLAPDAKYVNATDFTLNIGQDTLGGLLFRSITRGNLANAPANTVTQVTRGQEQVDFATNTTAFSGGVDYESDDSVRQRAVRYLNSMARSQAEAIVAIAENWTDSNSMSVRHVKAVEFVREQRGYTELVVSKGNGMPAATRVAVATSGTLPTLVVSSRYTMYFDGPAATMPTVKLDGVPYLLSNTAFAPLLEAGVVVTQRDFAPMQPGVNWVIEGHRVYQGWIAEFQDFINRTCVAAGTTVRVVAAETQLVSFTANCVVTTSRSTQAVFDQVRRVIVDYVESLGIGEPCFIHKLHAQVARVPGVVNIIFDQPDLVPRSQRTKLITRISNVTLR